MSRQVLEDHVGKLNDRYLTLPNLNVIDRIPTFLLIAPPRPLLPVPDLTGLGGSRGFATGSAQRSLHVGHLWLVCRASEGPGSRTRARTRARKARARALTGFGRKPRGHLQHTRLPAHGVWHRQQNIHQSVY